MKTIKETPRYSYIYDQLYGVSTIINRKTNEQTAWNTGIECQHEITQILKMSNYDDEFNNYCEKQFS